MLRVVPPDLDEVARAAEKGSVYNAPFTLVFNRPLTFYEWRGVRHVWTYGAYPIEDEPSLVSWEVSADNMLRNGTAYIIRTVERIHEYAAECQAADVERLEGLKGAADTLNEALKSALISSPASLTGER